MTNIVRNILTVNIRRLVWDVELSSVHRTKDKLFFSFVHIVGDRPPPYKIVVGKGQQVICTPGSFVLGWRHFGILSQ